MKKPYLILFTILILSHFLSVAQEIENTKLRLKIYYNFNRINYHETFDFSENNLSWIQPGIEYHNAGELSIALQKETHNSFTHEFELMPFSINNIDLFKTINPGDTQYWEADKKSTTAINSRFRYQFNSPITKREKFSSYIGISSMLTYSIFNFRSLNSYDFPERYSHAGIIMGLSPGIEFTLSNNLNLTVDAPIGIYGINYSAYKYQNPQLTVNDRKGGKFSNELWHQGFQVRIGVGLNL